MNIKLEELENIMKNEYVKDITFDRIDDYEYIN